MRSSALLVAPFVLAAFPLLAQQRKAKPELTSAHPDSLPVTHVSLYKNGVGFFEHAGQVSGNASVTIDFTSAQLNDVLQSLTALDLNGGRISGAGYNSTTPLDQQLRTLPITLDANPTISSFYQSLRGARMEIHSGAASFAGRLLTVELGETEPSSNTSAAPDSAQRLMLTLVSDSGEVHTLPVTPATTVRVLDNSLHTDITRYLQLLDSNRSQGLRHLTLEDRGAGTRELHVSYISEVPVWKSTYRILFTTRDADASTHNATVQGWSVIDNTTGTDWINVQLSLIAGAPQSFIQPLSQPIYTSRPEIAIAQQAQLTPQTFESALNGRSGSGIAGTVTDATGAVVPNSSITITNLANGQRFTANTDSNGRFNRSVPAGNYRVEASATGFQRLVENNVAVNGQQYSSLNMPLTVGAATETVEVSASAPGLATESAAMGALVSKSRSVPNGYIGVGHGAGASFGYGSSIVAPPPPPPSYEDSAAGSFTASAQTSGFDDFFAYNIATPITIRKNESALVPILQAKVGAESVTLVHSNGNSLSQPLRALWLTNSTGLTLDRGSFSIVENGNFGGEGLLDPIHPGEKRLLSYAADQAVHISTDNLSNTNHLTSITAANGILVFHRSEHRTTTYMVRNAASDARTVVLEHPVRPGFRLANDSKPAETAADVYRFRLAVPAGETTRLPVAEDHLDVSTFGLTGANEQQLILIEQQTNDPKLTAALQPIRAAQQRVAEADAAVDAANTTLDNLHKDEDRQRANITALASADKASRDRFVHDLNATEDRITATQKDVDARTTELEAAKAQLAQLIASFQFSEEMQNP